MARKPMVTRSIESTVATVMVCNTETGKTENKQFVVAGTYKEEKHLVKEITKQLGKNEVAVKVITTETVTTKYGMAIDLFMELATEIKENESEEK